MIPPALRGLLSRPVASDRTFLGDPGRLAVFLFGIEVVTGSLLALYYRPDPEGAFASVGTLMGSVTFGWLVRSLHRVTGHALLLVTAVYLGRMFFRRDFLRPGGRAAWLLAVGLSILALAFLLTGEVLPWDQAGYWRTVITARLVEEVPLVGPWMATVFRGGPEVSGLTIVRLFALHALLFPWIAFGGLLLAGRLRRQGVMR